MNKVTAYRCGFCYKLYRNGKVCLKHEDVCNKNPRNRRACFHCKHCSKKKVETTLFGFNGFSEVEESIGVNVLVCIKTKTHILPPKIERKKDWYDPVRDIETTEELGIKFMPKECELFEHY